MLCPALHGPLLALIAPCACTRQPATAAILSVPDADALIFVVDTSGSMRDLKTELLNEPVIAAMAAVFTANPQYRAFQILDCDGRFILGRDQGWLSREPQGELGVLRTVQRYGLASGANPTPAIVRAIKGLCTPQDSPTFRASIWVLSDDSDGDPETSFERLNRLNPRDANGRRMLSINSIVFPLVLADKSPGRFRHKPECVSFMERLAREHDGVVFFIP